jgi:hypothetical protein
MLAGAGLPDEEFVQQPAAQLRWVRRAMIKDVSTHAGLSARRLSTAGHGKR